MSALEDVGAVTDRLARIETTLGHIATGIKDERLDMREELSRHASRLDRVERFMWLAVGMSFASGVPTLIRAIGAAS